MLSLTHGPSLPQTGARNDATANAFPPTIARVPRKLGIPAMQSLSQQLPFFLSLLKMFSIVLALGEPRSTAQVRLLCNCHHGDSACNPARQG